MSKTLPRSSFVGQAGEYYVMAELLRRGINAGLLTHNAQDYDILAIKDHQNLRVRVKTKESKDWQFNVKKDPKIVYDIAQPEGDFTILVDLQKDSEESPEYYIVPTIFLNEWVYQNFYYWANNPQVPPGKRNKESPKRELEQKVYRDALALFHNFWEGLWLSSEEWSIRLVEARKLAEMTEVSPG